MVFLLSSRSDISFGVGSCHETSCLIEYTGNVTCIEPCSYVAHCKTDFSLWPYDRQNCSMIFGPWMNNEDEIDYVSQKSELSLEAAAEHTQWKLISGVVAKKLFTIQSNDKKFYTKFPNLIFSFTIERHASLITKIVGCKLIRIELETLSLSLFVSFSVMCTFDWHKHSGCLHRHRSEGANVNDCREYSSPLPSHSSALVDAAARRRHSASDM